MKQTSIQLKNKQGKEHTMVMKVQDGYASFYDGEDLLFTVFVAGNNIVLHPMNRALIAWDDERIGFVSLISDYHKYQNVIRAINGKTMEE